MDDRAVSEMIEALRSIAGGRQHDFPECDPSEGEEKGDAPGCYCSERTAKAVLEKWGLL